MRGLKKASLIVFFITVWIPWVHAGPPGLSVVRAQLLKNGQAYTLDADIVFQLTPIVLKTVQNGIPLVWVLRAGIYRSRPYLWDKCLAEVLQRYTIRYHALMNLYQVNNEASGEANYFSSLPVALEAIGTIRAMPFPEVRWDDEDNRYYARLSMQLDREALPLPLRPLAYLTRDWYLSTGWYSWSVQK